MSDQNVFLIFPSATTALLSNLHGLQFDVEDAIEKYNAHLGSDGDSNALVSLSNLTHDVVKFVQHKLTTKMSETDFHCHLQGAVNKRDAARFRSVCATQTNYKDV